MGNKVRRALHAALASGLYYSGALGVLSFLRRRVRGRRPVYVLGLHRVLSDEEMRRSNSLPGMILHESTFVALLEYLGRRFRFVSLDTLLSDGAGGSGQGKPWCLVTFDDAWSDTYRRAAPVLERLKIPAVVFVPTGAIGTQKGFWVEQLAGAWKSPPVRERVAAAVGKTAGGARGVADLEDTVQFLLHMPAEERDSALAGLPAPNGAGADQNVDAMMTWEQVVDVAGRGIEIGSHTETHPLLTYEDDPTVARELRASRQLLAGKLGAEVRAFAYPNGDWDARVRECVVRAGYSCAFTTESGCYESGGDPYGIPRFVLHEGNVTGLGGKFSRAMASMTLAGWR
jgi:peptidoglycan/xylan/chitin deacetylase (PgdA/CDA1 family)